ncbi:hypothetical protein BU26DRAFT_120240 [Trematosphaeria pertusa]|uniref:Uncharacterized protein n=1 Tax=Trematosphaeria pertusa TaxID=390896 RepID=A0A6A6HXC7_9PLEO|nr:uncharacterized protein BU26DRAFT_120240 [Trematosphaeria pertusa]KAF2242865.1 hypothetical protein BU26DRAFT_120240 [Trematosphaeria pertusa]
MKHALLAASPRTPRRTMPAAIGRLRRLLQGQADAGAAPYTPVCAQSAIFQLAHLACVCLTCWCVLRGCMQLQLCLARLGPHLGKSLPSTVYLPQMPVPLAIDHFFERLRVSPSFVLCHSLPL